MVTEDLRSAAFTAEKVIGGAEDLASSASGEKKSQEEIELRNMERTAKEVLNTTLNAAVAIEGAITKSSAWGSTPGWGEKEHSEEHLW